MKHISLNTKKFISKNQLLVKIKTYLSALNISNKRVLIVCEDITRSTPIDFFFKDLADYLFQYKNEITVLFALGTHRPMTNEEIVKKLGISSSDVKKLKLINHDALDDSRLVKVGMIDNVPLKLNKTITENDFLISVGSVVPHRVMGFSGGAKILVPGIANKQFIDYTHWKSNLFSEEKIYMKVENPMRNILNNAVSLLQKKFPLRLISINCVTVSSKIVDLFIDDFYSSYKRAALLSSKVFVRRVKECSSVLALLDDKSMDFWQGAKAVYNCARVIKNGGYIVVRGKLQEGISPVHGGIISQFGYSTPSKIKKLVGSGKLKDVLVASHMFRVSQHLERVKIFLSSEFLTVEECQKVNLGLISPEKLERMEFDYIVHNSTETILVKKD